MRGYFSKCGDEWTVLTACWIQTVLSLWGSWAGARDHLRFYSPQIWLNNNPKQTIYSYHENWDISSFTYQITIHFPIIWLHHLLNISGIFYATSFHWVIFPCRGWGKWRRHSPMSDKFLSIPQDTALLLRRLEYSVQAVGDHPLLTLINYQHVPVTCSQSLLLNPALDCKLLEGREYLILLICMTPEIQNPRKGKQRKWIN